MRLTGSVVQPISCYDLLTYKANGSNYLSFVDILLLASTTPLAEAGTATHFPLSVSSGRKRPADVGYTSLMSAILAPTIQSRRGHQLWRVKRSALRLRLTGSVAQPTSCYDLLTYKAIDSNYLSFVVILLLASTTPLAEAGTATTALVG